jgi:hypothetical protein
VYKEKSDFLRKMTNGRGQKQKLCCLLLPRISLDNFRKNVVDQTVTWTTTSYPPCSCNVRPTTTIIPFRLPTSSHLPARVRSQRFEKSNISNRFFTFSSAEISPIFQFRTKLCFTYDATLVGSAVDARALE